VASVICFIDPTHAHYGVLLCIIMRSLTSWLLQRWGIAAAPAVIAGDGGSSPSH
jgi:hypothetical protein